MRRRILAVMNTPPSGTLDSWGTKCSPGDNFFSRGQYVQLGTIFAVGDNICSWGQYVCSVGDNLFSWGQFFPWGTTCLVVHNLFSWGKYVQLGTIFAVGDTLFSRGQYVQLGTICSRYSVKRLSENGCEYLFQCHQYFNEIGIQYSSAFPVSTTDQQNL